MTQFTPEIIERTRQHFADLNRRCIEEALSGETPVNDLPRYIAWREEGIRDGLAGLSDHTFAFRQMAHYFATGECIPLFSK
jgi:hypothetical protein